MAFRAAWFENARTALSEANGEYLKIGAEREAAALARRRDLLS
jgi:hypothetical protein